MLSGKCRALALLNACFYLGITKGNPHIPNNDYHYVQCEIAWVYKMPLNI
jgi:hypothetical protein